MSHWPAPPRRADPPESAPRKKRQTLESLIARVFPRVTRATPVDDLAFVGPPPQKLQRIDAVQISVTFAWDLERAQDLAREWAAIAPVTLGGPAAGTVGGEFEPGRFLRHGYVITSRGCPNRCWFCDVWKRDGTTRELPIREGWNVLDDNLLACSYEHICNVIDMLARVRNGGSRRVQFTGGLEAARFDAWKAEAIRSVRPKQIFFAYDEPSDWEPLVRAAEKCWKVGFTRASHTVRCYVLCGWPKDSMAAAAERMRRCLSIGLTPMAMLWRNRKGEAAAEWRRFQREYARPALMHAAA